MTQYFRMHPDNPQPRLVREAVAILETGGVIVLPTDAAYVIACRLGDQKALERIRQLRDLSEAHYFTLMCRDLSELATFAHVDNTVFRILKAYTPGPYTFILNATREAPKRLLHPKRKTLGLRVPNNRIVQSLLSEWGAPLMSVSVMSASETDYLSDAEAILSRFESRVDAVVDGGVCGHIPTSVIDLSFGARKVLREGLGPVDFINN